MDSAPRIRIPSLYADLQASMDALRGDDSAVADSREVVKDALASGKPLYGINTGFGAFLMNCWCSCSITCCSAMPVAWVSRFHRRSPG